MTRWKKWLSVAMSAVMLASSLTIPRKAEAAGEQGVIFTEVQDNFVGNYGTERSSLFNDNWKFYLGRPTGAETVNFNDASWETVDLPHDFSISQSFTTGGEAESGFLPGGTGWYRKKFTLPASCAGKSVVLNFDGVYSIATVFVNGTQVGENRYGYNPFSFDITDRLTCDGQTENVIAVQAVNDIPSSRWYSGSGIYRDVKLIITDPVHVAKDGTYVTTPNLKTSNGTDGTVNVAVDVQNDSDSSASVTVRNTVYEKGSTKAVATAEASVTVAAGATATATSSPAVSSPKLWSTDAPNLYVVRTEIVQNGNVTDTYDTEFGFKWYEFVENDGFKLNGQNVKINGVCLHHDQGALGSAAYYDAMYRQLTKMKDMGVNTIRITHNPGDEDFVNICNEIGLLVIEEIFDGWNFSKNGNRNDFAPNFNRNLTANNQVIGGSSTMTWAEFVMKSTIKRDRNDASVILWSLGNEIQEGAGGDGWGSTARNLIQWAKEVDTAHLLTSGSNKRWVSTDDNDPTCVNKILYDNGGVAGFNYASEEEMESLHSTYSVILASETASAVNSRGVYTANSTGAAAIGGHLTSYDESCVGWGKTAHASMWDTLRFDFVAGECVWTGFDYIGEPTPWNGTGTGAHSSAPVSGVAAPNSSYFGIVETTGFEKDNYYLYRSQWNKDENTLHLVTAWDSDNIKEPGGKTPVWVYSNAAKIELYRDNQKIGTATGTVNRTDAGHTYTTYTTESNATNICTTSSGNGSESLYAVFNVAYTKGTLSAKAFDAEGNDITATCSGKTTVTTPDAASKLKLSQDKTEIAADGSSLAYISVDVTDAAGNLDTTATNDIQFTLSGNGEIVGVDNGDQATTDKYQQSSVLTSAASAHIKAYAGKALAIVRSTKDAGEITVNVSAKDLTGGTVNIQTTQAEQGKTDGISSYRMAKHCYVPAGTENISLPATVTAAYADGRTAELPVEWETYDLSKLNTPGEFIVNGTFSDAKESINVFITIHVYGEIAGAAYYSAITQPGIVPVLPGTAMTYYADGTAFEEFAVQWNTEGITGANFANAGDIVTIGGTVNALGGTYPVTAKIRVVSPVAGEYENIAPVASSLTQSCDPASDDPLESIVNGIKYSGLDDTNQRWTNWKDRGKGAAPVLTFKWDTAHTVAEVRMYYYHNKNGAGEPERVTFSYSLDGETYTDIGYASPEPISNEPGKVENGYIYRFNKPVNPVSMRIKLTQDTTATGDDAFVGVTEAEIMATSYTYPANTSALLDGISTEGKAIPGFDPEVKEYMVDSLDNITVTNSENAAVTILPAKDNRVKILTTSEDGSASEVYTLNLATEEQLTAAARQRLEAAIADAGEKDASLYTEESYQSMVTAKEAAQTVLDNQNASRTDIETALTALQNAVNGLEETKVIVPNLAVTRPAVGASAAESSSSVTVATTVFRDRANKGTTFGYRSNKKPEILSEEGVADAFKGKFEVQNNDEVNVSGDTPFLIKFKMKPDNINDTQGIIGKMDEQFGVQIKNERIAFHAYCDDKNGTRDWVEADVTELSKEDLIDKWSDVIAYYNGSSLNIWVKTLNGVRSGSTTNGNVKIVENTDNKFTIGYNSLFFNEGTGKDTDGREYGGALAGVKMYRGTGLPKIPDQASGEEKEKYAERVFGALETGLGSLNPVLDIEAANVSDSHYTVGASAWTTEDGAEFTGNFEAKKPYKVTATLTADAGYVFTEESNVTAPPAGVDVVESVVSEDGTTMTVTYTLRADPYYKATDYWDKEKAAGTLAIQEENDIWHYQIQNGTAWVDLPRPAYNDEHRVDGERGAWCEGSNGNESGVSWGELDKISRTQMTPFSSNVGLLWKAFQTGYYSATLEEKLGSGSNPGQFAVRVSHEKNGESVTMYENVMYPNDNFDARIAKVAAGESIRIASNGCGEGYWAVGFKPMIVERTVRDYAEQYITEVQADIDGTQYEEKRETAVSNAISELRTVAGDSSKTDTEVEDKLTALEDAVALLEAPFISGLDLTLDGRIGVNFHTNAKTEVVKVEFTASGEPEIVDKYTTTEEGNKIFTYEVAAKEMADEITAKLMDKNDKVIDTVHRSVSEYAEYIMKNSTKYPNEQELVRAMLNYGAAAQEQFNYHSGKFANHFFNDDERRVEKIGNSLDFYKGKTLNAKSKGFSLVLNSETALKMYFDAGASNIKVQKVKNPEKPDTSDNLEEVEEVYCGKESKNQYEYVKVLNIAANHLGDVYKVTVNGEDAGTVSAMTYCYMVATGNYSDKLKNLVNALHAYYQAAKEYSPSTP